MPESSIVGEIIELGRLDRIFGVFIEKLSRVQAIRSCTDRVHFRGKLNTRLQVSGLSSESMTWTIFQYSFDVPVAGGAKSRGVKVGDGIEARLGSALFVLSSSTFHASFISLSQISPVANPVYTSW